MNQTLPIPTLPATPAGPGRIAVISARWHGDIVAQAQEAFLAELQAQGVPPAQVDCVAVPGAFEIPLLAQQLARGGRHVAVAACALVVDGGIYRHDFVAATVVDALMRVQLDTGVPVFSGVLTPQAFHAHDEHQRFFHAHFQAKGRELAQACLQTLAAARAVQALLARA